MMRSPNSFAVAVRRADGKIVVRESRWISLSERYKFLKWPLFRGSVVLVESMHNGISALTFSANIAEQGLEQEEQAKGTRKPKEGVKQKKTDEVKKEAMAPSLWVTVGLAFIMAIGLFAFLPHVITWGIGLLVGSEALASGTDVAFHLVDGLVKMLILVGYMVGISFLPDVKRLFMYHGSEHKSIHAHERGIEMTVANAQQFSRFHERCGTAFLLTVLLAAVLVFSIVMPLVPKISDIGILNQAFFVLVKIPLLFPIGGIAYEILRLASRFPKNRVLQWVIWPGMMLQRITTKPPTDDQIEVAIAALEKTLWREQVGGEADGGEQVYDSLEDFRTSLKILPQA